MTHSSLWGNTKVLVVVGSTKLTQKPSRIEKLNNTEMQPRAKTKRPLRKFESGVETKDRQKISQFASEQRNKQQQNSLKRNKS